MQMLVTTAPKQRLRAKHPDVIGIGINHMNSLAKPWLNLAAIAAKLQNFQVSQRRIRGQQKDGSAQRGVDNAKPHYATGP